MILSHYKTYMMHKYNYLALAQYGGKNKLDDCADTAINYALQLRGIKYG
jgi:hypothetical protein